MSERYGLRRVIPLYREPHSAALDAHSTAEDRIIDPYSFDLQWIFFGDAPPQVLVELAFRTTVLFVYAIVLFRFTGARALSQLSLAEVVLIVGLGAAVGDPMLYTAICRLLMVWP